MDSTGVAVDVRGLRTKWLPPNSFKSVTLRSRTGALESVARFRMVIEMTPSA
jgi:hypothetical protein